MMHRSIYNRAHRPITILPIAIISSMILNKRQANFLLFSCDSLADVNAMLREQLTSANEASDSYAEELQKTKEDLKEVRDELVSKESQWKEDQEVFINQGSIYSDTIVDFIFHQ